jgi:CHAD domain-containing protein
VTGIVVADFRGVNADAKMDEALRDDLRGHMSKLRKRLKEAHRGKAKGIHDARTELRRIRAELDTMGHTAFDAKITSELCERLHDTERALAKARDAGVLSCDLEKYVAKHASDGLDEVCARLDKRRARGLKGARAALRGTTRDAIVRAVKRASKPKHVVLEQPKNPAKAAPELVRHFTHREVWRRYEALRAFDARLPADVETLHALRSACRELRYTLETFQGASPDLAPIARDLHERQDEIGELHDHELAIQLLERWRAKGKIAPSRGLSSYLERRARARDELRRMAESRWLSLLGAKFRLRLSRALEPRTEREMHPMAA